MMRRQLVAVVALLGAGGSGVACSLLVPLNAVQCSTDGDCLARGAAFAGAVCVSHVCTSPGSDGGPSDGGSQDGPGEAEAAVDTSGPWGCLAFPPGASDPDATVAVTLTLFDPIQPYTLGGSVDGGNDLTILQAAPEPGVAVEACNPLDPFCHTPVTGTFLTDDGGAVTLSLNGGFDGIYYMTRSDSFPTLFYPGRLLVGQTAVGYPVALLPYAEANGLGAALQIQLASGPDAGVGHIFGAVFDCQDRHVGGVSLALGNDAGTQFYLQNTVPSTSATETDTSGTVGWLNVPICSTTIQPTIVDPNGPKLPSYTVFVIPGSETLIYFRPRVRALQ
jgi:hypothetical protein